MKIKEVIQILEQWAPPLLQESYDNSGLLIGNTNDDCTGILISLDCLESIVDEAIEKKCNLIVSHHPIIFSGLKRITGKTYIERVVIKAIKHNIALYAIHTNLDNSFDGVNKKIAEQLGLQQLQVLQPKKQLLKKLFTYAPAHEVEKILQAIYKTGAGTLGNYGSCSFCINGTGSFMPLNNANPTVGALHELWKGEEVKMEVIFPAWVETQVLKALFSAHSYETVAYEIISLDNTHTEAGSGMIGILETPIEATHFFEKLKTIFKVPLIRHTQLLNKPIKKVALCGGAGSFLIKTAIAAGADVYISADIKYHEFFDADNQLVIADIGHYETEQYTIDLIADYLREKISTFAILKTSINTNSVNYF
jgi:dinuclear metal center YbgI/SA1388 family protein